MHPVFICASISKKPIRQCFVHSRWQHIHHPVSLANLFDVCAHMEKESVKRHRTFGSDLQIFLVQASLRSCLKLRKFEDTDGAEKKTLCLYVYVRESA